MGERKLFAHELEARLDEVLLLSLRQRSAAEPAASTERWANEVTDPKAAEAASGAEMVDPVAGLDRDRALEAAARTWAVVGGGRGVGVGERRR